MLERKKERKKERWKERKIDCVVGWLAGVDEWIGGWVFV